MLVIEKIIENIMPTLEIEEKYILKEAETSMLPNKETRKLIPTEESVDLLENIEL